MATIRPGNKRALLIIDVQNGVINPCYMRNEIVSNILKIVHYAKLEDMPIFVIQHTSDEELPENSKQWELIPELINEDKVFLIPKKYNSAFSNTTLEKQLEQLQIAELIIIGSTTNWCIRSTVFTALTNGYDLVLISDAHTTEDIELSNNRTIYAKDIIDEFNIVIENIEYPGIKTQVIKTEDFINKNNSPTTAST